MAKRLAAKTGEYEKNGEVKGEYIRLGVILDGDNGEFALLDPTVDLAGTLMKQNRYNHSKGKKVGDMLMVSVFSDDKPKQESGKTSSQPSSDFDDDIPF